MRGALTYLGDAERRIRSLRSGSPGWALGEQIAPHDTYFRGGDAVPDGTGALLLVPPWGWALVGGLMLAALPIVLGAGSTLVIVAGLLGALVGVYGRYRLTLALAEEVRQPSEEAVAEIHQALGEAGRFLHEAGMAWIGADPSVSPAPWKLLPQIHATLKSLHEAEVRALASGQG